METEPCSECFGMGFVIVGLEKIKTEDCPVCFGKKQVVLPVEEPPKLIKISYDPA